MNINRHRHHVVSGQQVAAGRYLWQVGRTIAVGLPAAVIEDDERVMAAKSTPRVLLQEIDLALELVRGSPVVVPVQPGDVFASACSERFIEIPPCSDIRLSQ